MTDSHRRRRVTIVIVLALLAGVVLTTLLIGRTSDQQAGTAATDPSPAQTAPAEPSVPATPLMTAPEDVTWELFEGVALPVSRTDGPTSINGPVHAGFARTPIGALLAAAQIRVRAIATPSVPDLLRVVDAQFVDGPGKAAYRERIARVTDTSAPAGGYTQYIGFRYLSYDPDVAVISLASRGSSGTIRAATATVRWVDGDWRLERAADAQEPSQVLQSLAGYVPWAGVT